MSSTENLENVHILVWLKKIVLVSYQIGCWLLLLLNIETLNFFRNICICGSTTVYIYDHWNIEYLEVYITDVIKESGVFRIVCPTFIGFYNWVQAGQREQNIIVSKILFHLKQEHIHKFKRMANLKLAAVLILILVFISHLYMVETYASDYSSQHLIVSLIYVVPQNCQTLELCSLSSQARWRSPRGGSQHPSGCPACPATTSSILS